VAFCAALAFEMAKLDTLKLGDIVLFSLGLKGYVYSELTRYKYIPFTGVTHACIYLVALHTIF
jgi:hypothetical protein